MKFYKQLLRNMVSEWSTQYVDYKALKEQIKRTKQKALQLADAFYSIRGKRTRMIPHISFRK
jgi:SPX domain protein involved in polyphosphate accumulation